MILGLLLEAAFAGWTVQVVFTASNRGELRPCGCPGAVYGGLAKRATLLEALHVEVGDFALLDAGDALFPDEPITSANRGPREAKATGVLQMMEAMGYDRVALSDRDLDRASADLRGAAEVERWDAWPDDPVPAGESPIAVARLTLEGLEGSWQGGPAGPPLVVLTGLDDAAIVEALPADAQPWLIVSSSPDATLSEPLLTWVGPTPVVRPTPKGKEYGFVRMWRAETDAEPAADLVDDDGFTRRYELASGDRAYELSFVRIPRETEDVPAIAELIKHTENAAVQADDGEVWEEWEGQTYTGVAACVGCHPAQVERWELTKHARAWADLQFDGSHTNLDCVGCHSTGYGKAGGFLRAASVGVLQDVQCEVCHGAGLHHVYSGGDTPPPALVPPAEICLSCHEADRSKPFVYEAWLPMVQCPTDQEGHP